MTSRTRAALFGLLLAAWTVAAAADDLGDYLQRQRDVYRIPAVVVGIIRHGELVDSRALGSSNLELGVNASTKHAFEIGSISKQFTAYGVLILVEQGKLELDAPVGRYLSDLPADWGRPTLRQLLWQVSGLPDLEAAFGYGVYRETPTDAEFQSRLVALPLDFAPGEKWAYSNTNYWLLARVVERTTGLTYARFMQERVFAPLGMRSTRTALPRQLLPGRASGYELVEDELENRDAIQPNTGRGLGDIVSTVDDMVLWEREQREPRLLPPDVAKQAHQPGRLNDGSATQYGMGWFTDDVLGQPALQHSGQTAGFVAEYLRLPTRDLAVVMFTNRYGAPISASGIARHVDPVLAGPPLVPARKPDNARLERVRLVLGSAARASTEWRAAWFVDEVWKESQPNLAYVERNARPRGALLSVTAVGPNGIQDSRRPVFRVVYENLTRVITVTFDARRRIASMQGEDE